MFLRFVVQSFRRSPRRKAMTVAAVAMGSAVATAMLGVMLDIGDRVNRELRSLGANLLVTPKSRSLPVEIAGISYRPVAPDDFIPEALLPKMTEQDWISYKDRWRNFGEEAAGRWLINKYGEK